STSHSNAADRASRGNSANSNTEENFSHGGQGLVARGGAPVASAGLRRHHAMKPVTDIHTSALANKVFNHRPMRPKKPPSWMLTPVATVLATTGKSFQSASPTTLASLRSSSR